MNNSKFSTFDNLLSNMLFNYDDSFMTESYKKKTIWSRTERTDLGIKLVLALPGVSKENINISIDNDTLQVKGSNIESSFVADFSESYKIRENIDIEKLEATVKNGVLTIFMPFDKKSKITNIKIS